MHITPREEVTSAFTRDEVEGLISESHREGLLDEEEHELLAGALGFEARTVRSVLLPLQELVTVAPDVTPREIEQLTVRTGYSRFPVRTRRAVNGGLAGYVHLKDVLETDPALRATPLAAKRIRPLLHIGPDDTLASVLETMQGRGAHLARVTEPDGTLLGVVTLEDVLAALIGEVG